MTDLNWRQLNAKLITLSEQEVRSLLDQERHFGKRPTMLVRLHQRYTVLRAARERQEMLRDLASDAN
jgi:hypothetical protein